MLSVTRRFMKLNGLTYRQIKDFKSQKFSDVEEIKHRLAEEGLLSWEYNYDKDALHRKLTFGDFKQALAFINSVGVFADSIDHHPEWFNVYNRLEIDLRTHDCNGVSLKDYYLACYIDAVAKKIHQKGARNYTDIIEIDQAQILGG